MARTPRNTLSSELVVRTALQVMETKGADGFSLRGVAAELGVGPMALYTYFRNKDDLYDAIRDHLMALMPPPPADLPWPEQVRAICRDLRVLMLEHPCLAQLLASRPLSGHETARVAEGLLSVLRSSGLDPETAARTHTTLFTFVLGATTWEIQMTVEQSDPDALRRLRASMESLSSREFPTVVELAPELARTSGGQQQFDYGLDLLLAGLTARTPS
ncbi:TetR/AcrR family transcriptional regulator [Kribbella sandramycini]|uniref:AcrR family transcriptional regulator n=1 Tax=Kribbella sandramycini TaxID=60450 RepID=A0A7Y4L0P1_9ACTN|nr:TetR/AcrR family transcriptional regulator [Kribbella sandramycini]MBB6568994.1 AcrR family transcriptional regulator [Kribbella sandramycini]NOL41161.1 TetR/AcrR family transcriptional regulator [Kribbella sandramycini]